MPLRRILLRVMLGSLGAAAVLGALAMLALRDEIMSRVVCTALITAGASGLMLGCSLLGDRPTGKNSGVLGMAAVTVLFIIAMAITWTHSHQEGLWLTLTWITLTTPPAMFFLRIAQLPNARLAGWTGSAMTGTTLLLLLGGAWVANDWLHAERWMSNAAVVASLGPFIVAALVGAGLDRRHWRWIGIAAGALAIAMGLVGITWQISSDGKAFTIVTSIAVTIAYANLVLYCPLRPGQSWLLWGTLGAVACTALLVDYVAITGQWDSDGIAVRMGGATGIMASCGTLALGVLSRLNRNIDRRPVISEIHQFTLICPCCQKKQTVPTGGAQCPFCKLKITAQFEEPHCPNCDYLLLMLTSDRCPECGMPVKPG